MLIASGITATHHIQDIALHLFRPSGRHVTLALLGDHVGDVTLLRLEVITHGLRLILLLAILEKRIAKLIPDRVEAEFGVHHTAVQVHLDQLGLQFYILVFNVSFSIQVGPIPGGHHHRVRRLISHGSVQTGLFLRNRVIRQGETIRGLCQKRIRRSLQILRIDGKAPGPQEKQEHQDSLYQKHLLCSSFFSINSRPRMYNK